MPGPVPNSAAYGEELKKYKESQKSAGVQAANKGEMGPWSPDTGDKYGAALDRIEDLKSMLETLSSRDTNKLMTRGLDQPTGRASMTAQPGSSIEAVQQYSAQQPTSPATESWVPGTPEPLPDESGLTQPMQPEVQPAIVDQTNMPPAQTVDPSASLPPEEGLPPNGAAGELANLVSEASAEDLRKAKAASQNPEVVADKVESGKPLELYEKIAWIGMLVAPVALGFALRGEKGAYLGGMAAGKGLEKLGESVSAKEKQEADLRNDQAIQKMKGEQKKEEILMKSMEGSSETKGLRTGYVAGEPTKVWNIQGTQATPVLTPTGQELLAAEIDPVTKERREYPVAQQSVVVSKPAPGRPGVEEVVIPQEKPQFSYSAVPVTGERIADKAKRLGVDISSIPSIYHNLDDAAFNSAKLTKEGESGGDATIRKEYAQKFYGIIEDADKRKKELEAYAVKEGLGASGAEKKETRQRFIDEYEKTSPWKKNSTILEQSDFRVASNRAQQDQSVVTADMRGVNGSLSQNAVGLRTDISSRKMKDAQGIADIGLLYTFIKMLDPTSVVREGEVYMAGAATPLVERAAKMYQNIFSSGSALSAEQRKYINNLISAKVVAAMNDQQKHEIRMEEKAKNLGLNWYSIQRADVAAELKDIDKYRGRAQGVPFIKSSDSKSFTELPVETIMVIEKPDGWVAGTKEWVIENGVPTNKQKFYPL